jgi:hypothetical protein
MARFEWSSRKPNGAETRCAVHLERGGLTPGTPDDEAVSSLPGPVES